MSEMIKTKSKSSKKAIHVLLPELLDVFQTENVKVEKTEKGRFISVYDTRSFVEKTFTLGKVYNLKSFNACYRFNACWMFPKIGNEVIEIPQETQFLMLFDGIHYELLFALVDKYSRSSIFSEGEMLKILVETGDDSTKVNEALCLYTIKGKDPYKLVKTAFLEIREKLKTFEIRKNKPVPKFVSQLGFCTYNAFYDKVSQEKILGALETFKNDDIRLGFVIIDGGWQNYDGNYTSSFTADKTKFPNGLQETVKISKEKYGVKEILAWHTYNGYWSGLKAECFPEYDIELMSFYIPERLKALMKEIEESDNTATAGMNFYPSNIIDEKCGFIKNDLFRFYFDFYSELRKQGIDGTKLDAMSWVECFAQNKGGRVRLMQQLVSSLEGSSYINFNNEHINCSCCSNDFFYNTLKSNVTRSSTDYFPDIPQSHGNHIFTNAHTAFWIGEVTLPDWDMFQSGNTAGEFHAMSKAISGGPVYFTDEIGMQKKEIINKLSTKDGRIGLCTDHARMTLDSMFIDPKKDYIPVKIFNYNKYGFVVGAFNCCYDKNEKIMVSTSVSPSDVYGIKGEIFYAYSNNNGGLGKIQKEATTKVSLNEFEGDIITFSPIANGFAVVGMVEKYNPLGFIKGISYKNNILKIEMLESGKVLIYSERNPKKASEDFSYSNNLIYVNSKSNKFWVEFGE